MAASLVGRVRRSLAFRTRAAIGRTTGRLRRLCRIARAPGDRTRSPAGPAATVLEPQFSPRAMARSGQTSYFAGGTRRYATCTGVAWTRPDRLVSAFLLGTSIVTYSFEAHGDQPRIRHLATAVEPERLGWIESLAVSPDGRWLATVDSNTGRCLVLAVDPDSGVPDPVPVASTGVPGDHFMHGVTWTPGGQAVLFTTIDGAGNIRVADFGVTAGTARLAPPIPIDNPRPGCMPKGVAFSPDGRFLAIGYGPNVTGSAVLDRPATSVDVHRYDPTTVIGERVSRTPDDWLPAGSVECVAWTPDGRRLVATDQVGDQALIADVDPDSGAITGLAARIGWSAGKLSFPHGCAPSPDGRWLAVTNYGDGSLRLYRTGP